MGYSHHKSRVGGRREKGGLRGDWKGGSSAGQSTWSEGRKVPLYPSLGEKVLMTCSLECLLRTGSVGALHRA